MITGTQRDAAKAEGWTDDEIDAYNAKSPAKPAQQASAPTQQTPAPSNFVDQKAQQFQQNIDQQKSDLNVGGIPSYLQPLIAGTAAAAGYGLYKYFNKPTESQTRIEPTLNGTPQNGRIEPTFDVAPTVPVASNVPVAPNVAPTPVAPPTGLTPEEMHQQALRQEQLNQAQLKTQQEAAKLANLQSKAAAPTATPTSASTAKPTAEPTAASTTVPEQAPVPQASTEPVMPPTSNAPVDPVTQLQQTHAAAATGAPVIEPNSVTGSIQSQALTEAGVTNVVAPSPEVAQAGMQQAAAEAAIPPPVVKNSGASQTASEITATAKNTTTPVLPEDRIPAYPNPKRNIRAGDVTGQGGWHWYQGQMGPEAADNWTRAFGRNNASYSDVLQAIKEGRLPAPDTTMKKGGSFPRETTVPSYIKGAVLPKVLNSFNAFSTLMAPSTVETGSIVPNAYQAKFQPQPGRGFVNPPNVDPNAQSPTDKFGAFMQQFLGDKTPYPHSGLANKYNGPVR